MKINRQPLPSLTEDILDRDHQFWKQFSKRLTGDIIDYDTPLKQTTDWIEKTYLRHDFNGFTGDRKFVHDDDAQKSFSKLRSSIGGIYAWRLNPDPHVCPPEYRPKSDAEYQRLLKEADFAFRQAFAFCPYSPEAVFRYCALLVHTPPFRRCAPRGGNLPEAGPVQRPGAGSCGHRQDLQEAGRWDGRSRAGQGPLSVQLEDEVRKNPADFQAAFNLAGDYLQMQQTDRAVQVLEGVLNSPQADAPAPSWSGHGLLQLRPSRRVAADGR